MDYIVVKGLKKYYVSADIVVKALDGVSLNIKQGEFIAIRGASGSGKSTLLHMIGCVDVPDQGEIWIEGVELTQKSAEERTEIRRNNIGFVFQNYNLITGLNVADNIRIVSEMGNQGMDEDYFQEIICALHLEEKLNFLPGYLSGGQQQRVAIARALSTKPAIILADEPTGNLDSKTAIEVMKVFQLANQMWGQTILMITHDEKMASFASRQVFIADGKLGDP